MTVSGAPELTLTNARIVLSDEVLSGTIRIEGGAITAIDQGSSDQPGAVDLEGDLLIPGLIELHTDNLERQFQPRPKVRWPADAAMLAHDQQMVAAGFTTVCDAVCVGFYGGKRERLDFLDTSLRALDHARSAGALKADHFLHLRCEVSDPHAVNLFEPLRDEPTLKLVSFMDHTPGQRQWSDLDRYRTFHRGRTEASEAEFEEMIQRRLAEQKLYAEKHRQKLLDLVEGLDVVLASHDDTTPDHVDQAAREGITLSEFPTTLDAADRAHAKGMGVIMGAPNVVLGGSHSGNVSTVDLARHDRLDALSSDYVPQSSLLAALKLADLEGWTLPRAVSCITATPAAMLGLDDRGRIEIGRRADLVRLRRIDDSAAILSVWRQGERVA